MSKKDNKTTAPLSVEALTHHEDKRRHIPTDEMRSVMEEADRKPVPVAYERRNRDLDPQLVWRGKDQQDWSDLVVQAPPLYIQEKIHPKFLIDDLRRQTAAGAKANPQLDLFADFNGLPNEDAKTEFYQHDANWSNRMILGDSLQVMASLAEREGLRGKVQCIYFDPPYGIKFNSNFQWSTTSRDVKDGSPDHITREPEQVKAFRDTWRDGIHSYLSYFRDRLTVARDLLTDSGSIFVQIGDENVHRVRAVMDEVFGEENFVSEVIVSKTAGASMGYLDSVADFILFYAKNKNSMKYRNLFYDKQDKGSTSRYYTNVQMPDGFRRSMTEEEKNSPNLIDPNLKIFSVDALTSQTNASTTLYTAIFEGKKYDSGVRQWATPVSGFNRLHFANRITYRGNSIGYVRFLDDYPVRSISNIWSDISGSIQSRTDPKVYVVQTSTSLIQRCLLMATDPGDLVLDPTCGSGTTAYVAEQWGRRWITIDTSRVALALARARVMGARYPFYLLADSREGQKKEAEVRRSLPSSQPVYGRIRQGFVYERVPHITLKSIANNAEIDVIWETYQTRLEPLRAALNKALNTTWEEWEIPREAAEKWPEAVRDLHAQWWQQRIGRQKEIDASIAAKADYEYLYDRPYEDKKTVRVAGPFTVESLSPHRMLGVDENEDLIDLAAEPGPGYGPVWDFGQAILENLKTSGVQQAHKEDKIVFTSLTPWPGDHIGAEGRYAEGDTERRAGIYIGPEFGTVTKTDLVEAARECGDAGFDVLIACAFSYEAACTGFEKLGRIRILRARMNADLHMATDLKNTGKGNLFVIFGEPDIELLDAPAGQKQVKIKGIDVFDPKTGEVRSDNADGIACWFVDTDYDGQSFFVRHAYFLGANDPYKNLKTSLKAEIDEDAWATLYSDTSRPFIRPAGGRIAVKAINHLGDEVMKVFRV